MILKNIQRLNRGWQAAAASMVLLSFVVGISLPAPSVAAAAYSCGAYSSGAYSSSTACNAAPNGNSHTGTIGAPNTGFAKLMEPANLAAILGSLALLIAGIIVMLKSRGRKKQDVSFTTRS